MFKTQTAADAGTAVTTTAAVASWLVDLDAVLQIGLTLVGIATGIAATLYHLEGWRQRRNNRK